MPLKRTIAPLLLLCLSTVVCRASEAPQPAGYPSRPLQVIVTFSPGGGMDKSMRLLARHAERELGQRIEVVNRTAGGNLRGNLEGIQAPPDGYVLGVWGMGLVTDELVIRNAPYTHKDVLPLCLYSLDPHVITVGRAFADANGIKILQDLVDYVRANPGKVTCGVGGNWTTHDFVRLMIEEQAGVKFVRMPFLGGAPALKAAADGNCDVAVPFLPELLSYRDSDLVLPLAVTGAERLPQIPGVPTTAEAGYPDLVQSIWRVVSLPRGTPRSVVDYLAAIFRRTLADAAFQVEANLVGINPVFMAGEELERFIDKEYRHYSEKTREYGIRVER